MKKVIRLTENDISKMVSEALTEIGWQTPNDLYDTHKDGAHYLYMFSSELKDFIEKWSDEYENRWDYHDIRKVNDPIKSKVLSFLRQAEEMVNWCERKVSQIEGFEQASEDKFKQQNGKSMEDYTDEYWTEKDNLFNQYVDDKIDGDVYDQGEADLDKRYPEINNITRY